MTYKVFKSDSLEEARWLGSVNVSCPDAYTDEFILHYLGDSRRRITETPDKYLKSNWFKTDILILESSEREALKRGLITADIPEELVKANFWLREENAI